MQVGAGIRRHGRAQLLVLAMALTACGQDAEPEPDAKPSAQAPTRNSTAGSTATAVASGVTVGAPGSACELPVTFATVRDWKAETIDNSATDSGDFGDLALRQGPVTAVCEIDAKPAGNIGFLRVFTAPPGNAGIRSVLAAFVAAEGKVGEAKYTPFKTGGLDGVQVDYLYSSEFLDEPKQESALAVGTPEGPVVLHLGGLDTEEHRAMLPALELARRTLRVG
ncbi:lipoprotein [Streptomyces sp. NPDC059378]|uniref:lipoprotein n=1 Tax=Streptomyces sp. NPDC059378 TaxID=3346815 RepID=UPI0036ACF157